MDAVLLSRWVTSDTEMLYALTIALQKSNTPVNHTSSLHLYNSWQKNTTKYLIHPAGLLPSPDLSASSPSIVWLAEMFHLENAHITDTYTAMKWTCCLLWLDNSTFLLQEHQFYRRFWVFSRNEWILWFNSWKQSIRPVGISWEGTVIF